MSLPFIEIRHNIEVAHRLFLTRGKCQQIHGHSMWVELRLFGQDFNDAGLLLNTYGSPLEFGEIKALFREHLDMTYDHHLLLNADDPWAQRVVSLGKDTDNLIDTYGMPEEEQVLPGLMTFKQDPTTENIAHWIATFAAETFCCDVDVVVRETSVNAAAAGAIYNDSLRTQS